jgi:pimeloyl-ACP methyl ester carboxylesterase
MMEELQTVQVTDRAREVARALLTPTRRAPRPSAIVWERQDTIAARYGPIVTWTVGTGPTVLLVHGWEADHVDMDAFVAPLLARGRRVVTFDLPAHGESSGERASLPDLATALEDVVAAAGDVDAAIAHSVGCATTAVTLAAGASFRRVAFLAPPLRYAAFARFYAEQHGVEGDAIVAALAEAGVDVAPLDIRKNAAGIDVPLLIVHSKDDRVCDSSNATKIAQVWNGARASFVEGLGHTRILRDPDVVASVVDFVTEGATSTARETERLRRACRE